MFKVVYKTFQQILESIQEVTNQIQEVVENMKNIDNNVLLKIYYKAIELKLEKDFIIIIQNELTRRGLSLTSKSDNNN
jgi:developmental checkpoint coupling sporulation initiation to replication initiation